MPYIPEKDREKLDPIVDELFRQLNSKGEYNYAITRLVHLYIDHHGMRYDTLNDAMGIMQCAQLELYRSIIGPYEDKKIIDNGSVGVL